MTEWTEARWEAELAELYGTAPAGPRLVRDEPVPPAEQAKQQAEAAIELTELDTSGCLRLPWNAVGEAIGPLLPWQFWVLAAATGNGKTTMLMSIIANWIGQDRRVWMLPLEQPTDLMRLYLAALRQGLDPRLVQAGDWHRLPPGAIEAVRADLHWQATPDAAALLHMSDTAFVDENALRQEVLAAVAWGAEVVVIDHLHRLQMTGHRDGYHALVRMCQLLKELAKTHRIPMLVAAQLNRGDGSRLSAFYPPKPTSIQGGEVIRQECDVALGLFRPLRETPDHATKAAIEAGVIQPRDLVEPNCLGVSVLKHRVFGDRLGEVIRLRYERGQILDPTEDQRRKWVADQEGIRL